VIERQRWLCGPAGASNTRDASLRWHGLLYAVSDDALVSNSWAAQLTKPLSHYRARAPVSLVEDAPKIPLDLPTHQFTEAPPRCNRRSLRAARVGRQPASSVGSAESCTMFLLHR
jgi:hypothetical protein